MSEERDDIIILIDENGDEVEVEHIDTIEYNNNEYVVLLPREDDDNDDEAGECEDEDCDCDDCDEEEVVILKIEKTGGEEESFVAIEDEDEQNAVFEIFTQRMEEMEYDEDDEDEDDEDSEDGDGEDE
ncbi:MAG: DUF1292 domain-containing protein [Clostridiales bacterium]|jgi:uncharacterized protein YrzB (UPF0473 family)|nr:DUF1292 domain-containing protein [Clostridiales bacterium]